MSFSSSDDDSQQRFALGIVFAIVALVVASVLGGVVFKRGIAHGAGQQAPAVAGASIPVVVEEDSARVVVENGVVKFYFASASAELATGANEALADAVAGVKSGKRAVISGYHDATGNLERNQELAKKRAQAVQAALIALGAEAAKVELQKPQQTEASGSNARARRVEVILVD